MKNMQPEAADAGLEVDTRPRTAVLHQFVGMGDLVWHVPYFQAIAQQSQDGKVWVIASPTTFARDLIGHEPWVQAIIDFDRRPRTSERRTGRHAGLAGLFVMAAELREFAFDRIVLFSDRENRALVAKLARIPVRLGFGSNLLQRLMLTPAPRIRSYRGPSVPVYKDATAFSLAQGFCTQALVPKLTVRADALAEMETKLGGLPTPRFAFAIGSSEPFKQWGARRFGELAQKLLAGGFSVVVLGGPGEAALANEIDTTLGADLKTNFRAFTNGTLAQSAAALSLCDACIGNDTGISNLAAALNKPSFVLLGPRPLLDHDPLMRLIKAKSLDAISVDDVWTFLHEDGAPGFEAAASGDSSGAMNPVLGGSGAFNVQATAQTPARASLTRSSGSSPAP
jgi:heptosyltransferase-2